MSVCRDHQAREALGGTLCPHCYAEHTMVNELIARGFPVSLAIGGLAMLLDAMDAHKKGKHYVTLDHIERVYAALARVCDNYDDDGNAVAEYKR